MSAIPIATNESGRPVMLVGGGTYTAVGQMCGTKCCPIRQKTQGGYYFLEAICPQTGCTTVGYHQPNTRGCC